MDRQAWSPEDARVMQQALLHATPAQRCRAAIRAVERAADA
jgi:hypothetical protein